MTSSLDEYLHIDTPENVAFGYEVAGLGSRFLASLADTVLIILLQGLVGGVLLILGSDFSRRNPFFIDWSSWLIAIISLLSFAFFWGFYVFFEMVWNGQTPGKRWVGLRVIRANGLPITLAESIIRNLVRLVDFLPVSYGVGVVTMFIDAKSRRLGDLAAGTLVVREREAITLASLSAAVAAPKSDPVTLPAAPGVTGSLPVDRLAAADLEIAEAFLRRRAGLSHPEVLARQLLPAFYRKMELALSPADESRAIEIIEAIVRASRQPPE